MEEVFNELVESLTAIGYNEELLKADEFASAMQNGVKSNKFRQLVAWITDEIRVLADIEEKVHGDGELNDFMLELSAFLKDMMCPFASFISGPVSNRIQTLQSRHLLLDYLISELMALRMAYKLKPKENVVIELSETPAAVALKTITISLNMGKPPENIAAKVLFDKIYSRIDEILQKSSENLIGKPIFTPSKSLTADQWSKLEKFQKELEDEYNLRREMLITRLDVTIQSFQWSDRMKGKEDKIASIYSAKRERLNELQVGGTATDLIALLAAREELAIIEKTSSANVRKNTQASIQRHVIGKVPDRGGRAFEHAPPPPEMPSWQQNRSTGGGGFGGGPRGGHGGGRGGFQSNQSGSRSDNYQQQLQTQGYPAQQGQYKQSVGYVGSGNTYQQQGGIGGGSGGYDNRGSGGGRIQTNNCKVQGGWSQGGYGNDNRPHGSDRSYGNNNRSHNNDNRFNNRSFGKDGRSYGNDNNRSSGQQTQNPFDQPYNANHFYERGRRN